MERQLGHEKECDSTRPRICKQVLDRLLGVILMRRTMLIMMVCNAFQMHLCVFHLHRSTVGEPRRLPNRCKGLTKKRQQQNDGEQPAHEWDRRANENSTQS